MWNGDDPFLYARSLYVDHEYPHTNLLPAVIDVVLDIVKPAFWLEAGSMLGGSAIRTAERVKASGVGGFSLRLGAAGGAGTQMRAGPDPQRLPGLQGSALSREAEGSRCILQQPARQCWRRPLPRE